MPRGRQEVVRGCGQHVSDVLFPPPSAGWVWPMQAPVEKM